MRFPWPLTGRVKEMRLFEAAISDPGSSSGIHARGEGSGRFPVIHGDVGRMPVTLLDCLATRSTSRGMVSEIEGQEILAALLGPTQAGHSDD